ncbi:hypothetical protein C8F01DRAFT_1169973 [Mycena amicta]|nr:hypothetical protein C8F01DRAFT_1169973 [Mycena amicta]
MDTRAPPPGAPGRFGFKRVYRTNLRPVVIAVAALSALWSLFGCIGFFRSISIDKHEGVPKLATFAIVVGAIYMGALGVVAATLQRVGLVGAYAYASFAAIALTLGGGVLQVVVHFTSKSDILKVCTDLATGSTFAVYPFGFWGPSRHDTLDAADAASWCNSQYDRSSWQNIVSLLITVVIWCSFSVLAWGYYRQVLDPTSVVNSIRAPSNRFNGGGYPLQPYNAPYNASIPNLGYAAPYGNPNPVYAPPPGAPPPRDGAVGYGQDDKENPFADFDQPAHTERDVTSRPGPGGRETF